jgi:hypothetical protein
VLVPEVQFDYSLSRPYAGGIAKNKVMPGMPLSNAQKPIIRGFKLAYAFYPP